jgi:hypothetical protein
MSEKLDLDALEALLEPDEHRGPCAAVGCGYQAERIAALVNAFPALIAQAKAAEKWRVYAQHLSGCDALLYLPSSGRADMPCTCGFRALSAEEVSDAR